MKPLVYPVVNLNGNDADDLLKQTMGVLDHVRALQGAMINASDLVHGRNFQHLIHGDDWYQHEHVVGKARDAWRERIRWLETLEHDLTNMALDIQRQKRERERA
jgi:hypothetical protein